MRDRYADLEISLRRADVDDPARFRLELAFRPSQSDQTVYPLRYDDVIVTMDAAVRGQLAKLEQANLEYGQALGRLLFGSARVKEEWQRIWGGIESTHNRLRLRLDLHPDLYGLHWERLCLPEETMPLAGRDLVFFSRFIRSASTRVEPVAARPALRALVVIANPADLAAQGLDPIQVTSELDRARQHLPDVALKILAAPGEPHLAALINELRQGYDLLYLAAHGTMSPTGPVVWLTRSATEDLAHPVSGADLVQEIGGLDRRPGLVILASCESAGTGRTRDNGNLAALGPRLAAAGLPAVLAMQGNVRMKTVARFMPTFFQELQTTGRIDQAAAWARQQLYLDQELQADAWVPVLFLQRDNGLWWQAAEDDIRVKDYDRETGRRLRQALSRRLQRVETEIEALEKLSDRLFAAGSAGDPAHRQALRAQLRELEPTLDDLWPEMGRLKRQIQALDEAQAAAAGPVVVGEAAAPLETAARRLGQLGHPIDPATRDQTLLYDALLKLDYIPHVKRFHQVRLQQPRAVLLLIGDRELEIQYGLQLLLHRLRDLLYRIEPRQVLRVPLQSVVFSLKPETLWQQLAQGLADCAGEQSDPVAWRQAVGRCLARQLQHQHVVLTLHDMSNKVTNLETISQHFWQPLVEAVHQSQIATSGLLFLFVVDYHSKFSDREESELVRKLPPVDRYERSQLDDWFYGNLTDLPAPLQAVDDEILWTQSEQGVADRLLDYLCQCANIPLDVLLVEE